MSFKVIIPARYASTRLPGKPLLRLAGRPMIQYVYERACESGAAEVIIATDDERIRACAESFGADVCMTASHHRSGTERLEEVTRQRCYNNDDIVVNLQGDEPLMPSALLRQVADNLRAHPTVSISSLCTRITTMEELFDVSVVKVVRDRQNYALYFSRAPIPWDREHFVDNAFTSPFFQNFYRHLGIYAFQVGFLQQYVHWPPCMTEQMESLEQLRVLWQGQRIHVDEVCVPTVGGVDTLSDLARVEAIIAKFS